MTRPLVAVSTGASPDGRGVLRMVLNLSYLRALEAAGAAAAKHTAALAQVQLTSSFKGEGIAALRTHFASFAQ